MKTYGKIVTHIPHSSIQDWGYGWVSSASLFKHVKRMTDWHTDLLFKSNDARVENLVFPHSRFYLDVERIENDPMETIGQGKIYTEYDGIKRSSLTKADITNLNACYDEWKLRCAESIVDDTLVIDCHSFPSDVSPDVDVCIGFNDDGSRPSEETIDYIVEHFKMFSYRVSINKPYSNSIVFGEGHESVMVELNKSVYMDESTLEINPLSYRIRNAILSMFSDLSGK